MTPHDALVEARLDEYHLIAHDSRRMTGLVRGQIPVGSGAIAAATPAARRSESFRVRLGLGLVALGAALAGEDEGDRVHHAA